MRLALAMVFLIVCSYAAWAAQPAAPPQAPPSTLSDFDRNVALGSILETRPGTQVEVEELRHLADRGLAAARAAVAKTPNSADAQYTLASWLLYGYRVVSIEQMSYDTQGGARRVVVDSVVQGLTDDPTEGLEALKKATILAPDNTGYLLDYAAGLIDYDRGFEANDILKKVWSAGPPITLQNKIRAGLLLSTIALDDGDLEGAREWVYSALSLDPNLAEAVDRLRYLDTIQVAEMERAPAEQDVEEVTPSEEIGQDEAPAESNEDNYYEEYTPSEEQGYEEQAPEDEQYYEEPAPGEEEGSSEGVEPPAPPTGEEYGVEPPEPPTEPYGEEDYSEEPNVPEPPEPPAPPTGDEYGSGYVEPPSNQPGISEETPGEVPGY